MIIIIKTDMKLEKQDILNTSQRYLFHYNYSRV